MQPNNKSEKRVILFKEQAMGELGVLKIVIIESEELSGQNLVKQ